jgi:hypothetical protein
LPFARIEGDLTLNYSGRADLALRGPVSGRIYQVGPAARRLAADPRDVDALLRTGQFSKA